MNPLYIWYANGSMLLAETSAQWAALPAAGVQIVFEFQGTDENGNRLGVLHMGADWYWLADGAVGVGGGSPVRGVWEPAGAPAGAVKKSGLWIDDFEAVMARVNCWLRDE